MYGTREVLCNELESMFSPDEPLLLLIWTGGSVEAICDEFKPDEEEVEQVMQAIGGKTMEVYQSLGVNAEDVREILRRHREEQIRKVSVPAQLLERVISRSERELRAQGGEALMAGRASPLSVERSLDDIYALKALLAA